MAQLCPLGHPSRNRGPFWVAVIHLILHITWCYERVQFMEWFMSGKYIVRQARIGCQQWHILRCLYYLFAWNLSWFILSCCVWLSAYRLMLPRFKHSITVTCNTIGQPALCKTSFRWRNAMLEGILQSSREILYSPKDNQQERLYLLYVENTDSLQVSSPLLPTYSSWNHAYCLEVFTIAQKCPIALPIPLNSTNINPTLQQITECKSIRC